MEIKNNLETKIKSLTKSQIKFIDENEDLFFCELKKVLMDAGFKKELRKYEVERKEFKELREGPKDSDYIKNAIENLGIKKWEKIKKLGNTSWHISDDFYFSLDYRCDKKTNHKIDISISLDDFFQKKIIEKGFFSNKITWERADSIDYKPLKSYSGYYGTYFNPRYNYNELLEYLKNPSIRLKYDPEESEKTYEEYSGSYEHQHYEVFILIKNINQCLYDFFDTIETKIQESKSKKNEVKSKVKSIISKEFDKNSDGFLDIIQGDDLLVEVLEKNESVIVDFDHTIILKIIRLNNYLKLKRKNLSEIFEIFKKIDNDKKLKKFLPIFRNSIDNYQSLLIHSLNMILSIKNKELIVFHEIYEFFDQLEIFNSKWENEISGKLSSIELKLEDVMNSINSMENSITLSINNLRYTTKSSFESLQSSLTSELKSIRKGVGLNNLLTGIQTYQVYKINKNTKSLN